MNEEIKPCPFCGKKEIRVEPVSVIEDVMTKTNHYRLEFCCKTCGLVKPAKTTASTYTEAVEKSINIWNNRGNQNDAKTTTD